MALIVSDGTGKPDAESYADLAFMLAYATAYGLTLWTNASVTDTSRETSARLGTQWIDVNFGSRFLGTPLVSTQALAFPRQGACDRYGNVIEGIPTILKNATTEAAIIALVDPLFARGISTVAQSTQVLKRAKAGSAEVEYFPSGSGTATLTQTDLEKKVAYVKKMLEPLMGIRGGLLQRS